jgi:hypothetical protein
VSATNRQRTAGKYIDYSSFVPNPSQGGYQEKTSESAGATGPPISRFVRALLSGPTKTTSSGSTGRIFVPVRHPGTLPRGPRTILLFAESSLARRHLVAVVDAEARIATSSSGVNLLMPSQFDQSSCWQSSFVYWLNTIW